MVSSNVMCVAAFQYAFKNEKGFFVDNKKLWYNELLKRGDGYVDQFRISKPFWF